MMGWLDRLLGRPCPASPGAVADAVDDPDPPMPLEIDLHARTLMASCCRDCDDLPKVARAGEVVERPDGARVQVMHNGLVMLADAYCGSWMTDLIRLCRGHHEPQEERVFYEVVRRLPADATMIELGAWWAYYSLWFLRGCPARRCVAVEPEAANLEVGRANAALNGLAPVFVRACAGDGTLPFIPAPGEPPVPCLSVEAIMAEQGISVLDLLHCDAQGVELQVLRQCAGLIRTGRLRTLVLSTHHHLISHDPLTHQRCLALVRDLGGHVLAEHDVQESYSGDGLIAARFGAGAAQWPTVPLSFNRASTSLFRHPLYDLQAALRG
jgi:FkbM family methyltransferase